MKNICKTLVVLVLFSLPLIFADAQIEKNTDSSVYKAKVQSIISTEEKTVPGTSVKSNYEMISAKILEGDEKGKIVELEDDYISLNKGDVFYIQKNTDNTYSVADASRLPVLAIFTVIFIILVLLIGGFQGLRGLLSLAGSFILILYVLLPSILNGFSPIVISILVSSFIIILGSYITHGFNTTTTSAVIGMIVTVIITGGLAYVAVTTGKLTGYGAESSFALSIKTNGSIDILGVLLGGIMIGLLGVLYDVAIGQAISVEELHKIAPHISRTQIFSRALRIGKEHIGALVNTLAIAYVGASLPLLLLLSQSEQSSLMIINKEIFAAEIIRILIGSIGLVLAVPVTTVFAVLLIIRKNILTTDSAMVKSEIEALDHLRHHH